jgi:hypothetical protein
MTSKLWRFLSVKWLQKMSNHANSIGKVTSVFNESAGDSESMREEEIGCLKCQACGRRRKFVSANGCT